mgnify:CR=1 FL=1
MNIWRVSLYNDQDYLFDNRRIFVLRTVQDTPEEDWKTAVAHSIPPIPKGEYVIFVNVFQNYYGEFMTVEYHGSRYSVNPKNLEYVETREKETWYEV